MLTSRLFSAVVCVQMNGENNSGRVFAVSIEWFQAWQRFVRGDSEGTLAVICCCLTVHGTLSLGNSADGCCGYIYNIKQI